MKIKIDSLLGSKRERTRDQLLVSAQSLLMSEGAAALGLRQITTHAGMVHASFYNYYPDVAALIGDLGEQARRFCRYRFQDQRHRQVHFII